MRIDSIKSGRGNRLALFVLGWACGPRLIGHIEYPDVDIACIYDYRDLDAVLEGRSPDTGAELSRLVGGYGSVTLVAWSFGVWVAERLFGRGGVCPVTFEKATALNGTPLPADQQYGIGRRRLAVTVRGMAQGGKDEFDRKAYGPWYEGLRDRLAAGTPEDNVRELEVLAGLSVEPYEPSIRWTTALIGSGDTIFPPENMQAYWDGTGETVDLPHYPFGDKDIIKRLI